MTVASCPDNQQAFGDYLAKNPVAGIFYWPYNDGQNVWKD